MVILSPYAAGSEGIQLLQDAETSTTVRRLRSNSKEGVRVNPETTREEYEAPELRELGTVSDFTQAEDGGSTTDRTDT